MEKTLIHHFKKIFIDEKSRDSKVAERFIQFFPREKIEFVQGPPKLGKFGEHRGDLTAEQFALSKRLLYIKPFEGSFFKRCPGFSQKKALTCCNYHVLNLGQQCNFNCSYCYLQSYLNSPTMMIFSNLDQALNELHEMATQFPNLPFRVGTGEVIDSLSLDPLTLFSVELIEFFRQFPAWTLELKTKSANVDQFLNSEHAGNVVVSWSINAEQIIESEEHGTARLHERLEAAKKVINRGFRVAFHLDPLIWHPEWKTSYGELIHKIVSQFTAEEVQLISLGTLRFQPEQRHMMRERFGMTSKVVQAEMHPSESGKLRYDSGLRREMFNFMMSQFRVDELAKGKKWNILMCMETPETWISQYEDSPMRIDNLKDLWRPLPKIRPTKKPEVQTPQY